MSWRGAGSKPEAVANAAGGSGRGRRVKILIVDDDEDMRNVIRLALESHGHVVREFGDGIEALKFARADHPDLMILDVNLPGVDGYEICYLVKSDPKLRHTRVIMLTVRDRETDIAAGRGALADAYLIKPFDPDKLLAAIADLKSGARGPYPAGGSPGAGD